MEPKKPTKSMREAMPKTAAFIDDLRAAFGAELIDGQMRAALTDGKPTFWASENGHQVGVKPDSGFAVAVTNDEFQEFLRRAKK